MIMCMISRENSTYKTIYFYVISVTYVTYLILLIKNVQNGYILDTEVTALKEII